MSLEQEAEIAQKIIETLNQSIELDIWQRSVFLKSIGQRLRELRDHYQRQLGLDAHKQKDQDKQVDQDAKTEEVYISLYQSQGINISKWQGVVGSLVHHSVSRPIYKKESDARVNVSESQINNAYVAVKVKSEDIGTPMEEARFDKDGRELVWLKEGAIKLENIVCFIHGTGKYRLVGSFLVKQSK